MSCLSRLVRTIIEKILKCIAYETIVISHAVIRVQG